MTDAKPSKSSRKREYHALQELGEQLILLNDEQLVSIGTDEYLVEQVLNAKKISSNGALRRQKQLIGKIMRDVDPEPIRAALLRFDRNDRVARSIFKHSEEWRDRIASEGQSALREFESQAGRTSDVLAEHVAQHDTTADGERRRHIRRRMFREIHRILLAKGQSESY